MRRTIEVSLRTCSHVYSCELKMLTYPLHQDTDAAKRKRIILEPVVFKLKPSMGVQGQAWSVARNVHLQKGCVALPDRKEMHAVIS